MSETLKPCPMIVSLQCDLNAGHAGPCVASSRRAPTEEQVSGWMRLYCWECDSKHDPARPCRRAPTQGTEEQPHTHYWRCPNGHDAFTQGEPIPESCPACASFPEDWPSKAPVPVEVFEVFLRPVTPMEEDE